MKTATKKLTYAQIREAALTLRKRERQKLFEELEETLEPASRDVNGMNDDELETELNRRAAEAERDPSIMIPLATFREQMWKRAREGA